MTVSLMRGVVLAGAGVLTVGSMASAAIIAKYEFSGGTLGATPPSLANSAGAANVAVTDVSAGSGVNIVASGVGNPANSLAVRFSNVSDPSPIPPDEATAVSKNAYIEFSLTAAPGYKLDLSSLQVDLMQSNSTDAPHTMFIRSSLDGFTTTVATATAPTNFSNAGFSTYTAPLGVSFLDVASPTTLTFRLYSVGGVIPSGSFSGSLRHDNLIINGEVNLIPEPMTASLLGICSLVLMAKRRRASWTV